MPNGAQGLSQAQVAGILWAISPVNCPKCGNGLGWGGDYPYTEAVGAMGNLSQWQCLWNGLVAGGCYPPASNPSISWKDVAVAALGIAAVITGGEAAAALAAGEVGQYAALTFTSAVPALGSAAWSASDCFSQSNFLACTGTALDVISIGTGIGSLVAGATSETLVGTAGDIVGISGASADVFSLLGTGASNGYLLVPAGLQVPVPDPSLRPPG